MIDRKKKLKIIQLTLLTLGVLMLYLTYYSKEDTIKQKIISETTKEKIEKQTFEDEENKENMFYNITYAGLDLSGNRYQLKSAEAYIDDTKPEVIYMKVVEAINGIYNNKTLDMKFENNVRAKYEESELFAEKAEYSNTGSYLSIYNNVRINDIRGSLIADKLLFDIKKQKLDITSFNKGKINANVKLDEKRF